MILFERRNVEQYATSLAAYMPNGEIFASKNIQNSNFRKLLRGLAIELFRANGYLREYDVLPDETEKFLDEWESAVGIPDSCFSGSGDFEERRRDILIKLSSSGIQTEQDFIALAALFGVSVEIVPGAIPGVFPMVFPIYLFDSEKEARFTIIIRFTVEAVNRFPFTFPFTFGDAEIAILECLFNKLKPANCNLIFEQV